MELGTWCTLTRLGPASLYNEKKGVQQPNLTANHLYPLNLAPTAAHTASGQPQATAQAQGGRQRQRQRQRRRGGGAGAGGGVGGAGKAGASDEDREDDVEGEALVPDAEFPTLAQSMLQHTRKQQQQQQQPAKAAKVQQQKESGVSPQDREREWLLKHWPGALQHTLVAAAAASASAGGAGGAGGGAGGAAGSGSGVSKGTPAGANKFGGSVGGDVDWGSKAIYIALEYETLDGRRYFATPQQLGSRERETVLRQVRRTYRHCWGV